MGLHQAMTRGEKVGAIIGKDIACLNSWSPERRGWRLIGDHICNWSFKIKIKKCKF